MQRFIECAQPDKHCNPEKPRRRLTIGYLGNMSVGDGIDERVKVEGGQVRILCLDVHNIWGVVPEIYGREHSQLNISV